MKQLLQFSLVAMLFAGCGSNSNAPEKPAGDSLKHKKRNAPADSLIQVKAVTFDTNNIYDRTAAVIAGLNGKAGEYNHFFDSGAWKSNCGFIDSSWAKMSKSRLSEMRTWSEKEFNSPNKKVTTVFYPFSGPDFLTAVTFFPDPDTLVMLGLEPVGKLPVIDKMKNKDAEHYVEDLHLSLTDIFGKSYFITRKMMTNLNSQKVNGTLPLLAFFMKRTGNSITSINYLMRYGNDSIREIPYETKTDKKPSGAKINYVANNKLKTLYYFSYDISDKRFNDTTVFFKYLSGMNHFTTYIKSASYLLHNSFMSNVRKFILDKSNYVIQDDTGVPFKYFSKDSGIWTTMVYGDYTVPVKDFGKMRQQKELTEYFEKKNEGVPKLPFHLGYHWGNKKDVIIFASRKKAETISPQN